MRLSLAVAKGQQKLRKKLTVGQRQRTIDILKRYRFSKECVENTDKYCHSLTKIGPLNYAEHRSTPTRQNPLNGVAIRMYFEPELRNAVVLCCKWRVEIVS